MYVYILAMLILHVCWSAKWHRAQTYELSDMIKLKPGTVDISFSIIFRLTYYILYVCNHCL